MLNTTHTPIRRLTLVGLEAFAGRHRLSRADVDSVRRQLAGLMPAFEDDVHTVACTRVNAPNCFSFSRARRLWREGPDEVITALVTVLREEPIVGRFQSVTLCAGDRRLADVVGWLGCQGVEVSVVAPAEHLSCRLRLAAARVVALNSTMVGLGRAS
jgi:hypothetical protein